MRRTAACTCCFPAAVLAILLTVSAAQADNWMTQIGGVGSEVVFDLVETSDQRLCATGTFTDEAQFGEGRRQVTLRADAIQDIYVACFDAGGRLQNAVQFGADISDQPRAMAALPDGDILVTGYFLNSIGVGKSRSLQASGGADIFLIRLNKAGEEVWSRRFGGSFADSGTALAIAPDGDILLAGNFQDTISYAHAGETKQISSSGGRDAFVFRLDSDGTIKWAESFGGKGRDEASRVAVGVNGTVYVAGTFESTALVAQKTGKMTALNDADAFLIAFGADGAMLWSRQVAGSNREYVSGLAIDAKGDLYVSGNFSGDLQPHSGATLSSAGGTDIFLLKFAANGDSLWQRRVGGPDVDESFDLAITADQALLLSGHFQGSLDLQIAGQAVELKSHGKGNPDGFVLTIDAAGEFRQAVTAAGDGVETVFAVTALQSGGIATAGFFNREVLMEYEGLRKLQKRGKTDVFLVRVSNSRFRTSADATSRQQLESGSLSAL